MFTFKTCLWSTIEKITHLLWVSIKLFTFKNVYCWLSAEMIDLFKTKIFTNCSHNKKKFFFSVNIVKWAEKSKWLM